MFNNSTQFRFIDLDGRRYPHFFFVGGRTKRIRAALEDTGRPVVDAPTQRLPFLNA